MKLDVYDALIRAADAANQKIPELVNYLRYGGKQATVETLGKTFVDHVWRD